MANPLYYFFSSRAGIAGTVLRWTLAAFVLHGAVWQMLLLTGHAAYGEMLLLPWLQSHEEVSWTRALVFLLLGSGLLLGFFTRACSLVLLIWLLVGMSEAKVGEATVREILLSASLCLTLTLSGAGRLSLDRRIGAFFLPNF